MGNCFQKQKKSDSREDAAMNQRLLSLERQLASLQNQLETTTAQLSKPGGGVQDNVGTIYHRDTTIDEDFDNQFDNDVNDDNKDASFANTVNNINIDNENNDTLQMAHNLKTKMQVISSQSSNGSHKGSTYICVTTPGGLVVPMHERNIAVSSLERYTGCDLTEFQPLLLVTNFPDYVRIFAEIHNTKVCKGSSWSAAHSSEKGISILNYNMGSPNAALLVDIVARIELFKMVLFVGMVGGVARKYEIGDFFVPMAAVREEQTSNYYLKPNIPAIPGVFS